MQILNFIADLARRRHNDVRWAKVSIVPLLTLFVASALTGVGCKKDTGDEAIETDANGYMCINCGAKFYTSRGEFLESICPKCGQYTLVEVVGYMCKKDHHITIRPRVSGPDGAAICEICSAHLTNTMVLPHEKDLIAWGAAKAKPQQTR